MDVWFQQDVLKDGYVVNKKDRSIEVTTETTQRSTVCVYLVSSPSLLLTGSLSPRQIQEGG